MINNLYTGSKYYITPVREATGLQSLDQLKLSKQTERYLLESITKHFKRLSGMVDTPPI